MIMKIKFLLPALAGLAMVSCSQDEDFVNAEMQRGEFSPVTFSVSRENGANTREWMGDEYGRWNNFTFVKDELLSLFNGATIASDEISWEKIGQNAVFEGEGVGEELVFKTRSLVNPGSAIMVYPADTVFANTGSTLTLKVSAEQTAETKDFIPYVSDVMDIAERDAIHGIDANNTAGYGRQYDVILRPAASLFGIKIDPTETVDFAALGVKGIEFKKVEMTNGSTELFSTEATVSPSTTASNLSSVDSEKFGHFTKQAEVAQVTGGGKVVASISTEDIKDNIAYFTLLPMADGAKAGNDASIKVYTTYGSVTVANDENAAATEKGPLQNVAKDAGNNLKANLDNVIGRIWTAREDSKFGTEKQGRVIRRSLSIDLSTLDMCGTLVKDSEQLINILKVYKALKIDENEDYNVVNLILDGADGEFNLSGDALAALKTYNSGKKVKLDVATKTQKIVLNDANATLDNLKDETVIFVDAQNKAKAVDVVLGADREWTLDQAYTNTKINEITSKGKLTYTNTTNVADGLKYKLNVEGKMEIGSNKVVLGEFNAEETSEITVGEKKTVTFSDVTTLYGKVSNEGILSANATVSNYGTIDNKFELSVLRGGSGLITNVGTIWNNGPLAVTFITNNEDTQNKGRIILTNKNDNVSIKTDKKGYIVYTLNQATNNVYDCKKATGDVFNWLVVETEGVGAKVNLKSDIEYLEIKGDAANVETDGARKVTDLFVNSSMRLLGTNELTATNIYVNDYILHSGKLVGTQQTEYTSGVYGEAKDVTTYKNGQIRTVSSSD